MTRLPTATPSSSFSTSRVRILLLDRLVRPHVGHEAERDDQPDHALDRDGPEERFTRTVPQSRQMRCGVMEFVELPAQVGRGDEEDEQDGEDEDRERNEGARARPSSIQPQQAPSLARPAGDQVVDGEGHERHAKTQHHALADVRFGQGP